MSDYQVQGATASVGGNPANAAQRPVGGVPGNAVVSAAEGDPEDMVDSAPITAHEPSPVGDVLAELDTLGERELAEHPAVFDRIHGQLRAALSLIDDA